MKTNREILDSASDEERIGGRVGLAMARDVIAEGMPREWTGLDAQDADQLTAAGLEPGTERWAIAEKAAKFGFEAAIAVFELTGQFPKDPF